MQPATVGTTDEELDAILAANLLDTSPPDPEATSAEYNPALDVIVIKINNGTRLVIPREQMQGLENATPEELSDIEVIGGQIIGWTTLDVHHHIERLMAGKYATERWKQTRTQHAVAA